MHMYRFYYLGSDGHIAGAPVVVEFPDDRVAIEAAEALLDRRAIDVWELARVVVRLEPKQPG